MNFFNCAILAVAVLALSATAEAKKKNKDSSKCVNPGFGWRIKRNLDTDWDNAVEGFQTVFTDPNNPKFPTLVVDGLANLTVYSLTAYEFDFSEDGIVWVTENITNYDMQETCALAEAVMITSDGFVMDVNWVAGIDHDDEGNVAYYFGFKTCTIREPTGMPTEVVNLVCNEKNIGVYNYTNQKRWACIIDNWEKDDVLEICGDLRAILTSD